MVALDRSRSACNVLVPLQSIEDANDSIVTTAGHQWHSVRLQGAVPGFVVTPGVVREAREKARPSMFASAGPGNRQGSTCRQADTSLET